MLSWLFRCPLPEGEQARKWRALNALLLIFLTLMVLVTGLNILLQTTTSDPLTLLTLAILGGLYVVNRCGLVTFAAIGLIVGLEAIVVLYSVSAGGDPLPNVLTPTIGALPIALSATLLSWRAVPITVLAVSGATIWLYTQGMASLVAYQTAQHVGPTFLIAVIILFIAIGALSGLSSRQVEQTLARLQHRNGDLERANRDLAAQRERDLRLQANLGSLATALSAVSSRQGVAVTTQASSISQVVSAVAELDSTASQIADRATEVRQAADQALSSVQQGQSLLLRSREAVERNRAEVQLVIQRMRDLDQLTRQVTHFVDQIRHLAEDTHLLALNATIEAAGAGTFGRRFQVVADEVRALSTQSSTIVNQIQQVVSELQQAGHVALTATQSSAEVAELAAQLADDVRITQEQIVIAVRQTNALVHLISAASTQQTSATQEMTYTMEGIAEIARATSEDTRALDRAVSEMLHAATLLNAATTPPEPSNRKAPVSAA
jgi:methyl-accepting chemotaxis protein